MIDQEKYDGFLKESQLLLEAAPVAIVGVDQAGRIVFANVRLEEMFGYTREALIGEKIESLMPGRFHDIHLAHRADYMAEPRVRAMGSGMNLVARHQDGSEFPIEVGLSYLEIQGKMIIMGSITDITIRKQLADILEHQVKKRTREIEQRRRISDGMRDTLAILNSDCVLTETFNFITSQAVDLFDDANACAIYRLDEDNMQFAIETNCGLPEAYISSATILTQDSENSRFLLASTPIGVTNIEQSLLEAPPSVKSRRQTLLAYGFQAYQAVPITVKAEVYGGLVFFYPRPRAFSQEDFALAAAFSDQVALAITLSLRISRQTPVAVSIIRE